MANTVDVSKVSLNVAIGPDSQNAIVSKVSLNIVLGPVDATPRSWLSQAPLLVLNIPNQPVLATQTPLLVVNLPIQGTKITQAPVLPLVTPNPIPLPKPVVPELPMDEVWAFKTVVSIAESSKEQRSALLAQPRVKLNINALILNETDRRDIYQMLFKYVSQPFNYPNYVHSARLTAAASAGATKLFFDPADTDMREGEVLALYDPTLRQTYFSTITTLDSDGANLAAGIEVDALTTWQVCPAPLFRTTPIVGLNMRAISGDFKLDLTSVDPRTVERPGAAPSLTTFDGLFVLDKRPLADENVDENFNQNVEWLDNQIAGPVARTNWVVPFVGGTRNYLIHRPEGMDYWRAVAATLKGRQTAFLLPTYRDDLPLSEVPALGATILFSTNVQLFDFWRAKTYQRLMIKTANGVIYRKVLEVLCQYDTDGTPITVSIKLATALGTNPGDNTISAISYLNVCRLADDEIKLEHGAIDTVLSLEVRAINE